MSRWPAAERKANSDARRSPVDRYLTVILASVQSFGIAWQLQRGGDFVVHPALRVILMTMLT